MPFILPTLCFSQNRYIQTPKKKIISFFEYENEKKQLIQKFKEVAGDDAQLNIMDSLYEVRHTPDSVILAYKRKTQTVNRGFSGDDPFDRKKYLNSALPFPELEMLDGTCISFDSLKGKPTLISFWRTTNESCTEDIPELNNLKKFFKDRVNFIAVTADSKSTVKKFLNKTKFNFAHITDARRYVDLLGIESYPLNIFLDKDGIVRDIQYDMPTVYDRNAENGSYQNSEHFYRSIRELL